MFIVGKILKAQGIKGEVKASILTSFPEHFESLTTVYIENKTFQAYSIASMRLSDRFVYIRFEGVSTRNDAEQLRNKFIYIPEDELTALNTDEFYIHDLMGLHVFSESGAFLGEIVDVENYAGNDVYVVGTGSGGQYLIPAIKDVIRTVDLEQKKMIIRVMDGLLE